MFLDATIDVLLEQHRDLLRRGAVLVDRDDTGTNPRVLLYLEHTITDARVTREGLPRIVSRRLEFVELLEDDTSRGAGPAPYLDYVPASVEECGTLTEVIDAPWLRDHLDDRAIGYAIGNLAREHLDEVRERTEKRVSKTIAAVKERLTHEIIYWDRRAEEIASKEQAGKVPKFGLNSARARARANDLAERLERRLTGSGPIHRPPNAAWFLDLRDRCIEAEVAFFFKQWGGRTSKSGGRLLDGRDWSEMPTARERWIERSLPELVLV